MDHVRISIEEINFLTIKRFHFVSVGETFENIGVLSSDTQTFITYMSPITHSISHAALFQRFLTFLDNGIKIFKSFYQIWSSMELKQSKILTEAQEVTFRNVCFGYFKNRSAVVIRKTFEYKSEVSSNPR